MLTEHIQPIATMLAPSSSRGLDPARTAELREALRRLAAARAAAAAACRNA